MDPLLVKYYESELQFIREMGSEFAREYPKVAASLDIDGTETADPYVERLLEGFAFLAARVHLRIDAEYPRFAQNLLNIVYPEFLSPTPAMTIARLEPSTNASIDDGFEVSKGTTLRANLPRGEQTACEFQTVMPVNLLPLTVSGAEYFSNVGEYVNPAWVGKSRPRGGLRLTLTSTAGQPINEHSLDALDIFLSGQQTQAIKLYELLFARACGVVVEWGAQSKRTTKNLGVQHLGQVGFEVDDAMTPVDARTFSGYRLLREYFAFAERFLFFSVANLAAQLQDCDRDSVDIIVLFDQAESELENRVTAADFSLFCVPTINLFSKSLDRVHLDSRQNEFHLVADRTRPLDYEIYEVGEAVAYGATQDERVDFLPFYKCNDVGSSAEHEAYYTVRRERRLLSTAQKTRGTRTNYIGSEVYVSLVDSSESPFESSLKQLGIKALVTNRDLPLKMAVGRGVSDFSLDTSAPLASIRAVAGPTKPRPSLAHREGEVAWKLISQLSLSYLTVAGDAETGDASALRELLSLYADKNDAAAQKQIDGVQKIRSEHVTRRLPFGGPIAFARGLRIEVTFEEAAFVGSGIFLLGAILDRFFARMVSINSFTETVVVSEERGEVMVWPVRIGQRQIL
jgi:type VI secretion system protein ImpG